MRLAEHLQHEIESIGSDTVHGAEVLTQRSIDVVLSIPNEKRDLSTVEVLDLLRQTVRLLVMAQPAIASIANVANTFLGEVEGIEDAATLRTTIAQTGERLRRSGEDNLRAIADRASPLIEPGTIVVTHSRSETVYRTLLTAAQSGSDFTVFCTESPPMMEGVTLANQLKQSGIKVHLFADEAILSQIARARLVLVGADTVNSKGLVNKAGTRSIAVAANSARVPFYALCSSFKFSAWNRKEAAATPGSLFDTTPLEALSAIITERGSFTPPQVLAQLASSTIHPFLLSAFSSKSP